MASRAKHETLSCPVCDLEIYADHERAQREIDAHRAECHGYEDPKERFDKGDRVQYSDFGQIRLGKDHREGEVTGFGTERGHAEHCVYVRWDGRKTAERYAHRFIKHVD